MTDGLLAFDRLWQRLREPNDALRPRLAEWIKQVVPAGTHIKKKRGPAVPITPSANAVLRDDGWRANLSFFQGPTHEFPIAPAVPVEPTAEEWQLLGLEGPHRTFVPMAWLLELFGEAWIEAGMKSRGLPLYLFGSGEYRGPGDRMGWKELLRAMAYRTTAPMPPGLTARATDQGHLVSPPFPLRLPDTPPALVGACQAGEDGAVLAWAEALDAAGDQPSAELLRWLHAFPDATAEAARIWAGRGPFWVYAEAKTSWWGQGEGGTDPGDNDANAARLAQLLTGWNVYYPAIEWYLRRLSLRYVEVQASYFVDGARRQTVKLDLGAGAHLTPVDAYVGVTALRADSATIPADEAEMHGESEE